MNVNSYSYIPQLSLESSTQSEAYLDSFLAGDNPSLLAVNKNISIEFVGDVLLARNVEYLMRHRSYVYPYQGYSFSQDSYVYGNFEAAVPEEHIFTQPFTTRFSVDSVFLPGLFEAGFTHVSLANNHSLDFGVEGYANTVQTLMSANVLPAGSPAGVSADSISFHDIVGAKVAVIALNVVGNDYSPSELAELFTYAASNSDLQVVYVHWGEEYQLTHSKRQREYAKIFVANGADLIIGHHPHVVQDVDLVSGVPVFYSLGNYIFDQYFNQDVQEALLLTMSFQNGFKIEMTPVTSMNMISQPQAMNEGERDAFLNDLAQRSAPALQKMIRSGTIFHPTLVATSTKIAMIDQ